MKSAGDCLFCKVANRAVPSQVVFETDDVLGFKDIHPQAPVHLLFIPKKHVTGVEAVTASGGFSLDPLVAAANHMARESKIHASGYRIVINCKRDGGQTVDHLHLHLLGGRSMTWPPG